VRAASTSESGKALKAAPAASLAAPLVPSLTATKTDSFPDPDGDGKAEPGDTITYTVQITNNGTDAANVVFSDTVDPNTTLVPGSVATQPIASGDTYSVLGNMRIQPPAAQGLLSNDCDPDNGGPCSSAGLTATGPTSSAQGGNVSVNADGSFSYNPPAGFEGTDSFNYTVTDATGHTDTATATFNVNEVVWFVDNAAPAGGDGRLTNPFNNLASVSNAGDPDEPFDIIYVLQGAGSYGGGIVLEDSQRLIGQGIGLDAALASFGISVPPHSDTRPAATGNPTLANAGGDVVTLANSNVVAYLNASAAAPSSSAVAGSGAGGSTLVDNVGMSAAGTANGISLSNQAGPISVTGSSVSANSSGTAVIIDGGASAITFTNTTVSQNGGRVADIQNRTGGNVIFNGSSTVTGTNGVTDAVSLLNNTGGSSVTFAAAVQLNTNAPGARGLVADSAGGFTLNMTSGGNAVSSTGGAAVDVEDVSVNINFATTFSTDSNNQGVRVNNVSGAAAFGNTAVNNSTGTGVLLSNNSASLTFTDLDVAPAPGQRALHATSNTGTLSSASGTVVTNDNTAVEITGTSAANRTPLNIQLTTVNTTGGAIAANGIRLVNTSASGSPGGFRVLGTGGTCNATTPTCTGGRITNTTSADSAAGAPSGTGVALDNAATVVLTSMRIDTHANYGIRGNAVSGFTLSNSLVDGVNGTNQAAPFNESSIFFTELSGTSSIDASEITGGFQRNLRVDNSLGTLDLTINACNIHNTGNTAGDDGVNIEVGSSGGASNATLHVTNNTFSAHGGNHFDLSLLESPTVSLVFTGNTGTPGSPVHPIGLGQNFSVNSASFNGAFTYDVSNNVVNGARQGNAINLNKGSGAGTFSGRVSGNTIGLAGVTLSGASQSSGISIGARGDGSHTTLVTGNTIRQYRDHGILIEGAEVGTTTMNATVTGNTIEEQGSPGAAGLTLNGILLNWGINVGNTSTACVDIGGAGAASNNAPNSGNEAAGQTDVRLRQRQATTVRLPGYVGANNNNAAVQTYLLGRNNITTALAANTVPTGGGFVNTPGGLPCAQPSLASLNMPEDTGARELLAAAESSAPQQTSGAGFSQDEEFAGSRLALDKTGRGFANSERGQLLGRGLVESGAQPAAETLKTVRASAPLALAGETISIPIGTLRAGDSVTITFQVTVADPFMGAQPQVSNQGTVTADGGISVLTDDPSEPGAADPTVTPILLPPTINVNDATVAEPSTGSASAAFTVTLSHPFTSAVTVNFTTASGGANPATAGTDYTTTSGSVTFSAGETVQTISVPVLADLDAGEPDETFLVNLNSPVNGVIGDGQATGTITDGTVASPVIISELRTSGPSGSGDDFVELLNTTGSDITVAASDGSPGWAIVKSGAGCSTTPVVVGVVPNGTVIRARGNYLLTGAGYSLGAYAAGDSTLGDDIEDDRNVGLFTTTNLSNISSVTRLDAVGFGANTGNNCDLLREGNNLPAAAGSISEYSFVREVTLGLTHDTSDNAADFVVVSTTPSVAVGDNSAPTQGAPGPEGGASPTGPVPCIEPTGSALFGRELIDPTVSNASAPNVARDLTAGPNSTFGTLDFRRTFTNNTGGNVTSLRFRVVNLSTFPATAGAADLRALGSSSITVTTAGGPVAVQGTTLETPPAQASGGGVNSSLSAGSITLGSPLAPGASVNLRFLFGVEQAGDYNIAFVLEALSGPTGKDIWKLSGHTENGGHLDGGCNAAPVANAGVDQTVECSNGQASVTLDGLLSSDPDGDTPLTFDWSEGATSLGSGQTLVVSLPNGSHTITLTVTDPSGESSQDTVVVNVVDTTAPVVTPPANVSVSTGPGASSCGTVVTDAVLGTATATDGCEGSLSVTRMGVPAGNFFPVGTTTITYTATDGAGHTATATQTVTVNDNTPPVVTPPANINASADANSCSALLNPGTATATDNCSGASVVGTRSDSQPLNAPYPVGTTTITWTATDGSGNTASATQTVTVQDNQPPTVSASVAVTTMGPPFNHTMINVGLAASATDSCPGLGPLQVSVYSDEDDGTGPHSPDALDIGLGTLKLRRERDGDSNGRVYLVVVKATDASNNTAVSCKTVTVPLSNSAGSQAAVAAQAASAAAFCSANNGAPPSGFFTVGP
jgi:uncharacterized repeat protein (TIGR01451 family)